MKLGYMMGRARLPLELAESYAKWRSSRLGQITDALEQQVLVELVGSVSGRRLLDVGCGDGVIALEFSRHGAVVTGIDADPEMIAAARRRSEADSSCMQLIQARAEKLPFNDESFDCVLAVTVLCFVREPDRAVAEMARVLRRGGRLVIGELGYWSLWTAYRRIRGWLGNTTWQPSACQGERTPERR